MRIWSGVVVVLAVLALKSERLGADPLTIMPLGDSITAGAGVAGGYRDPLYTDLTDDGVSFQFVGATNTGATTLLTDKGDEYHNGYGSYPIEALTPNLNGDVQYMLGGQPYGDSNQNGFWITGIPGVRAPDYPNIVLLEIGTNNFLMEQGTPISTFDSDIALLITTLHNLSPSTEVLVAGAIPINDNPGFNAEISSYDSYIENTLVPSLSYTKYVDMYSQFTNTDGSTISSLYQTDNIHPSQDGYDLMATTWASSIESFEDQQAAVPEPSTTFLLLSGGVGLLLLRLRRRLPLLRSALSRS